MPTSEIRELTNHFVEQLLPVRIYLFGSFADSTYTEESDFDFYIIVHDAVSDIPAETTKAYKSIRKVKQRPVDIVVGTVSRFEARKEIPSIENEVYRKGVLLYDERKTAKEVARNKAVFMIQEGKIAIDEIAEYFPELSEEDRKEIESQVLQQV